MLLWLVDLLHHLQQIYLRLIGPELLEHYQKCSMLAISTMQQHLRIFHIAALQLTQMLRSYSPQSAARARSKWIDLRLPFVLRLCEPAACKVRRYAFAGQPLAALQNAGGIKLQGRA